MAASRWSILALLFAPSLAFAVPSGAVGASPAPATIVFSAHPRGAGAAQLFRVQTTGEGLQQITTGRLAAIAPSFSPDGTRIVFARLGSGGFRVNLDGTGLRRLTSGRRDSYPVWSRDGRIAFLRPFRSDWRVYVMTAAGGRERRLPQAPPAGRPTWSADSKGMFIPSASDLARIDSRSGRVVRYYGLTFDETAHSATVSPGARMVAFVGLRISTGPPDCGEGHCPQFGLYLARVTRPHRQRRFANDTGPAGWSPDATTLVYVSRGALTLRRVDSESGTPIAVAPHVPTGEAPPAWQPR
jgi:WD40-like Beta Propeller Repeat